VSVASKPALDLPRLFPELAEIGDERLRGAVGSVWDRFWALSAYERIEDVPVALKWGEPVIRHAQAIVKLAVAAARIWEDVHGVRLQRDHLIAAALLMEVSNLVEFRPGPNGTEMTDIGKAGTHGWYAANVALEAGVPFPVVHVILSHSPNSGKAPTTPEAQLLHWICQASVSAFRRDSWTRKVMHHQ